mmetsp:Transcript_28270/g.34928  ORF Transcript_28270/g.34928 Transcript_28270/m.34928 type:complete len:454 (-) Transcript_28270:550-1911(-)
MAMATAMSQRPTPQQTSSNPKPPPPPPPRGRTLVGVKRAAPKEENNRIVKVAKTKKGNGVGPPPPPPNTNRVSRVRKPPPPPPPSGRLPKREMTRRVTIRKPTVLRDVECYTKQYKVGQGTYGSVFVGEDKKTKEIVALKRINTEMEENGFPITALREVKILKALNHENVIKLKEIVTSKEQNKIPKNVFMVFEYHEYDLTGILKTREIRFTVDHIKSWTMQLLRGVNYMHVNNILHRDLKASNILINKKGELRIADWGLARSWSSSMKHLTNGVVTLWYRPIELLLGCKEYSTKIDMWSVGCIIAEMFRRNNGLLEGQNEASQLSQIFDVCGHPNKKDWPNISEMCPLWRNYEPGMDETPKPCRLSKVLREKNSNPSWMTENAVTLISNLLTHNPAKRWSAREAVSADFFWEKPMLKKASELNMRFGVDAVHEWEARKKHEEMRRANGTAKK